MNMSSFETLHYEMIPVRSHSNEYEIGTAATSSTAHLTSMSRSTRSKGSFSRSPKVNRGFSFWLNNNFGKIVLLLVFVILLLLGIIVLLQTVYRPSYENLRYLPEVTDRFVTTFTTCGPIEGINDDGVLSFRGIPYARPPIGGGRWKFAEPMNSLSSCWSGTFKAFNSSSSCWQRLSNGTVFGDEDCLTLDIYTPRVGYDSPLPVIVIVTSEDFEEDSTFLNSSLALEKNVVLVKVQFRLGVFGFLRASVLSNRVYPRTSGNYGLSDIVKALLWVKHNIEHFSGEPGLVTLLSHGAAATLVTNLINYRDRYHGLLFTQLWLTGGTEPFLGNRVEQGKINQEFLSKIDCEDIDCLLDKEPEDVLNSVPEKCFKHRIDIFEKPQFSWMVVDGVYIKETLRESLDKETFHDVTTVIGGNAQQHATLNLLRMLRWNNTYDVENYVAERLRMINATEVWARYNTTGTPNYFRSYMTMVSELRTLCPLYFMAKELADHFHDKVYFYVSAMARAHLRDTTGPYADIRAILGTYEIKNTQDVNIKLHYLISVLSLLMQFIQGMPLEPDASHHNRKDISQIFLRTAAVNKPYEELLIYQDDSIVGTRDKRFSSGRNGFESDIFSDGFGQFDTMKKRFYGKNGFHDDIFSNGFGSFGTMKRSFGKPGFESDNFDYRFGPFSPKKRLDQDN